MILYYYSYFHPSYLLVILASIIVMMAQAKVNNAYSKYSRIRNDANLTGEQVAREIINRYHLNIGIERINGQLSDHYDPKAKVVRLSKAIHDGNSIASLAVAVHEIGHALQDQEGYSMLRLRHNLLPLANIGNSAGWIAVMIGLFAGIPSVAYIGLGLLSMMLLFQFVTLPVEFNASQRALTILEKDGYLSYNETGMAKQMLDAAALTYVAAVASTLLNLLRIFLLIGGRRRD